MDKDSGDKKVTRDEITGRIDDKNEASERKNGVGHSTTSGPWIPATWSSSPIKHSLGSITIIGSSVVGHGMPVEGLFCIICRSHGVATMR